MDQPRQPALLVLLALLASAALPAGAETAGNLLGRAAYDRPAKIGTVQDLVINIETGRVLYIIIEGAQGYRSLPVRALGADGRFDLKLAGDAAKPPPEGLPELRRARQVLGKPALVQGRQVGIIQDIDFQAGTGKIERVIVRSADQRQLDFPPDILARERLDSATSELPDRTPNLEEPTGSTIRPSDVRRGVQGTTPTPTERPR